jgi:hypothetical protein
MTHPYRPLGKAQLDPRRRGSCTHSPKRRLGLAADRIMSRIDTYEIN